MTALPMTTELSPACGSTRRLFLRRALLASAAAAGVPIAALTDDAGAEEAAEAPGPYGPLGDPSGLGILVPEGFTADVVAVSGRPVAGTDYIWRGDPDGAAIFDDGESGWYYAVNHESDPASGGGVSCVHFDADGLVVEAYSILTGTRRNCAGGATPWGTWLSCEEVGDGLVWECRPETPSEGVARPALGVFNHEAVAVDPVRQTLYLTEDRNDGLLYRFTPTVYPDLTSGLLEAAVVDGDTVGWVEVPDPAATREQTRRQLASTATPFAGGEGIWYHADRVFFTTKLDHSVWELDVAAMRLRRVWRGDPSDPLHDQLTGVDNLTVESGSGDLYVAEDGGNMEIVVITPDGQVAPFLRVEGQPSSELTGPVFSPDGRRLYFSSQRGTDGAGITYVVSGPFRASTSVADGSAAGGDLAGTRPGGTAPDGSGPDGTTQAEEAPDDDAVSGSAAGTDAAANPLPPASAQSTGTEPVAAKGDEADRATEAGEASAPGSSAVAGDADRATEADEASAPGSSAVAEDPVGAERSDQRAATRVDIEPATPSPGTTLVAASEPSGDRNVDLALAGGAVAAGLVGAALLAVRRRRGQAAAGELG